MVSKQVFFDRMNELLSLFPTWNPGLENKNIVAAWYSHFTDLTNNEFNRMVDSYIKNDRFNPTVGGLRQYVINDPKKPISQVKHEQMLKENGLL